MNSFILSIQQILQKYGGLQISSKIRVQMPPITFFQGTAMLTMIIAGSLTTLVSKFQNKQLVYEGPFYKEFFHPYMQTTLMFCTQFALLGIHFIHRRWNAQRYRVEEAEAVAAGKRTDLNIFLFTIPALCDFFSSTLQNFALNFISGSVYQMMKGGTIVTTTLFSFLAFNFRPRIHHIVGSVIAVLAMIIVGLSNLVFSDINAGSSSPGLQVTGFILLTISLVVDGFFYVYQQNLFMKYHLYPLQMVGFEGMFGICIYAIVMPVISFIPCSFGLNACVFNQQGIGFMEIPGQYFNQLSQNWVLGALCFLSMFLIAAFNLSGANVTKHLSAVTRTICDVTRTILIWGGGIIVTISAGKVYPNYKWQLLQVEAILIEIAAFILLIFSNLLYHNILKLRTRDQFQELIQNQVQ